MIPVATIEEIRAASTAEHRMDPVLCNAVACSCGLMMHNPDAGDVAWHGTMGSDPSERPGYHATR